MFYEPLKRDHGLRHDPFKALVAPRPIGWVSTVSPDGVLNLAPYSFFNAIGNDPPILMFSVQQNAQKRLKDTSHNILAAQEFVVNLVDEALAEAQNVTSIDAPPGVDELRLGGLAMAQALLPRYAQAQTISFTDERIKGRYGMQLMCEGGGQAITDLLTIHEAQFLGIGLRMFLSFATIILSWYGVRMMLAPRQGADHLFGFAKLLLIVSFGYAMIQFYESPIPGLGISFSNLITDQTAYLASLLSARSIQNAQESLNALWNALEQPDPWSILANLLYWGMLLIIGLAQFALLFVVSFGLIASAVCALLGPLFIPFFIVPHLEWLFWGWLKSLVQYAFYPVVANAYVFVFGNLLIHFIDSHPPPYEGGTLLVIFFPLLMLLMSFTFGVLKIPSLVNSLFTGRSGESAVPNLF